jgi:glycosyltransferase involved in cell wall biosynthesis
VSDVAIIIPCFNDGATIEAAVASALSQTGAELVVVNDGSTDPDTLAALDRLRGLGVRVLDQSNCGVAAARMAGVAATSAPLILPLDGDDLLAPDAVEQLRQTLAADERLSFVWGDAEYIGDRQGRMRTADRLDPWLITIFNAIPVTALIRRDALLAAAGWQPGWYEDWDVWLAFAERGFQGARVDAVIFLYRFHSVRRSNGNRKNHDAAVNALRRRHTLLFAAAGHNRRRSPLSSPRKLMLRLALLAPLGTYKRAVAASLIVSEQLGEEIVRRLRALVKR